MGDNKPSHLNIAISSLEKTLDLVAHIEKCADVNSPDAKGDFPLHAAIKNERSLKVIQALVAKGANVEAQDNNLRTPLHVAFECGAKKGVILYLLRHIENVNITDVEKRTLLHDAIDSIRDHTIWQTLVKKGANVEALDTNGRTPLHVAIDNRTQARFVVVSYFLKITKNVNSMDSELKRTLLHAAIEENCAPEIIRTLVKKGANLDAIDGHGRTPLHNAFYYEYKSYYGYEEDADIFSLLIKNTKNINRLDAEERTPLFYAFLQRHPPALIRALVDNGADFNYPLVFRLATAYKDTLSILSEAFPEELKNLKRISVSPGATLYSAIVLRRPHDWNCVDRPLKCLTERNKPFWSVIMCSIIRQRSFSLRLHSQGILLDEESTYHIIGYIPLHDVMNLLLAYIDSLHIKRPSELSASSTVKRQKV